MEVSVYSSCEVALQGPRDTRGAEINITLHILLSPPKAAQLLAASIEKRERHAANKRCNPILHLSQRPPRVLEGQDESPGRNICPVGGAEAQSAGRIGGVRREGTDETPSLCLTVLVLLCSVFYTLNFAMC